MMKKTLVIGSSVCDVIIVYIRFPLKREMKILSVKSSRLVDVHLMSQVF